MTMEVIGGHKLLAVYLNGEIDHHNAKAIRERIDTALMRNGVRNLMLDFSNLGFMDSSGIGLIMGRFKKVSAIGGRLILYGMNGSIRRMLDMCGIEKIAVMAENAEDIMEGLYQ